MITVPEVMLSVQRVFPEIQLTANWSIDKGKITPEILLPNRYILIAEPCAAKGIFQLDENAKLPEDISCNFFGSIELLAPPAQFLALCRDIQDWCAKNSPDSPLKEAFGGYSASYNLQNQDWEKHFRHRLIPWRRMFDDFPMRS